MTTPTYDLLASSVLTTATASVTFASISQDYRDLVVVSNFLCNPDGRFRVFFNGDQTAANYFLIGMSGDGASTFSSSLSGVVGFFGSLRTESIFSTTARANAIVQIMDYSATDKHKPLLGRFDQPIGAAGLNVAGAEAVAGRYANTSAITSATITSANSFIAGSTFHLYGIKA